MSRREIGRINDCEGRLRRDWQDFVKTYQEVKEQWRDGRRDRFEQQHLAELPRKLSRLTTALGELRDTLERAERELAEDGMGDSV